MSEHDDVVARLNRLALLGTQSAVMMHELRQPFFCLRALSNLAQTDGDVGPELELAQAVSRYVDAMEAIVSRYEGLARPFASSTDFDLNEPIGDAVSQMRGRAKRYGATLHDELSSEPLLVSACPMMTKQVAYNLIQNAYEAVKRHDGGGRVMVRTEVSGDWVRLEVEDDGGGLPAQIKATVTEPFVTSRASDGGTGLGLYVVKSIISEVHGTFVLENGESGVRAVVRLPKVA